MRENHKRYDPGRYYPMFVSLDQRVCLVVGGGAVAERKIRALLRYGASVRIVAQKLTGWLELQCRENRIDFIGASYEECHLNEVDIVFAATDDAALNRRVSEAARKRRLWCNMATDPDLGSFIVPSTMQQGALTIAISTAGSSPALARLIRERLEKQFGREWFIFIKLMGILRAAIQEKGLESVENQRLLRKIAALPIPEWVGNRDYERALEAISDICRPVISLEELNQLWDEAWK